MASSLQTQHLLTVRLLSSSSPRGHTHELSCTSRNLPTGVHPLVRGFGRAGRSASPRTRALQRLRRRRPAGRSRAAAAARRAARGRCAAHDGCDGALSPSLLGASLQAAVLPALTARGGLLALVHLMLSPPNRAVALLAARLVCAPLAASDRIQAGLRGRAAGQPPAASGDFAQGWAGWMRMRGLAAVRLAFRQLPPSPEAGECLVSLVLAAPARSLQTTQPADHLPPVVAFSPRTTHPRHDTPTTHPRRVLQAQPTGADFEAVRIACPRLLPALTSRDSPRFAEILRDSPSVPALLDACGCFFVDSLVGPPSRGLAIGAARRVRPLRAAAGPRPPRALLPLAAALPRELRAAHRPAGSLAAAVREAPRPVRGRGGGGGAGQGGARRFGFGRLRGLATGAAVEGERRRRANDAQRASVRAPTPSLHTSPSLSLSLPHTLTLTQGAPTSSSRCHSTRAGARSTSCSRWCTAAPPPPSRRRRGAHCSAGCSRRCSARRSVSPRTSAASKLSRKPLGASL